MIKEEHEVNERFSRIYSLVDREYERKQLRLVRGGLAGETYSAAEALVELDDDYATLSRNLREAHEEKLDEIREGRNHEDWEECRHAAKEIKICGEDHPGFDENLSTIVDSGLPLLGKAQMLSLADRSTKFIKETLGELPPGWEDEEDCAEETGGVPHETVVEKKVKE